jgi:hypothetical protein
MVNSAVLVEYSACRMDVDGPPHVLSLKVTVLDGIFRSESYRFCQCVLPVIRQLEVADGDHHHHDLFDMSL